MAGEVGRRAAAFRCTRRCRRDALRVGAAGGDDQWHGEEGGEAAVPRPSAPSAGGSRGSIRLLMLIGGPSGLLACVQLAGWDGIEAQVATHADARVEEAVEQVDHGVRRHCGDRGERDDTGDEWVVEVLDGVDARVAEAGDVEDRLDEQRSAEGDADVDAEQHGEDRSDVAADVAGEQAAHAHALGLGRAHVVLAELLDDQRAHVTGVDGGERRGVGQPRQQQVMRPLPRVVAEAHVAVDREDAGALRQDVQAEQHPLGRLVGEQERQHRRHPEDRYRHAEDGERTTHHVADRAWPQRAVGADRHGDRAATRPHHRRPQRQWPAPQGRRCRRPGGAG